VTAFSHQVAHENSVKEKTGWFKLFLEAFKLNFKCGNYAFIKLKDKSEEIVLE